MQNSILIGNDTLIVWQGVFSFEEWGYVNSELISYKLHALIAVKNFEKNIKNE